MENKLKYILGILVALIVLVVLGYFIFNFNKSPEVTHSTSDTKTVTTESITTVKNTFTVEQVTQIKKALTDSLVKVYGLIIKRLKPVTIPEREDSNLNNNYSYISEVDSQFVVKDSSGYTTDLLNVKSVVISKEPLPELLHLLKLQVTSFRKQTKTDSKTLDTVYVKENETFWERFTVSPNISAGYGLFNRQFDVYAGVGLSFEFSASEIFFSNKK